MKHRGSILCLGLFTLLLAQAAEIDKLLPPDEAYVLSLTVPDPNTMALAWSIAEGYYLYKDKLELKLLDATGVSIIRYQGCADTGECYPTINWTIPVTLPPMAAIAAPQSKTSADNTAVISAQSRDKEILPRPLVMLLLAVLLIVSATYLNAFLSKAAPFWHSLGNALAVVLLVYGILMLTGVAAGGRDPLHPLRGVNLLARNPAGMQHLTFKPIKTVADLERELAQAEGHPVMLVFYADWCVSCKEMEKYTFSDPQVQAALVDTILLQADVTANDDQD